MCEELRIKKHVYYVYVPPESHREGDGSCNNYISI
jgi:hypothetical protein